MLNEHHFEETRSSMSGIDPDFSLVEFGFVLYKLNMIDSEYFYNNFNPF